MRARLGFVRDQNRRQQSGDYDPAGSLPLPRRRRRCMPLPMLGENPQQVSRGGPSARAPQRSCDSVLAEKVGMTDRRRGEARSSHWYGSSDPAAVAAPGPSSGCSDTAAALIDQPRTVRKAQCVQFYAPVRHDCLPSPFRTRIADAPHRARCPETRYAAAAHERFGGADRVSGTPCARGKDPLEAAALRAASHPRVGTPDNGTRHDRWCSCGRRSRGG